MRYWCLLCVALLFAACSESESSVCGTDTDCKSDQTCSDGVCVTPSRAECTGDPDCDTGEQCIDKTCRPLARFDMGADVTMMPDLGQPDLGEPDMSQEDNINPEVVSITPANGTIDVATDTVITVTFSEDIDFVTVNFQSLVLKNPAGQDVPATVTYDQATRTATLTPTEPLHVATAYRVSPSANIRDEAQNSLKTTPSPDATFITVLGVPDDHVALAAEFAPAIFQSIETPTGGLLNNDLPTRVNFDNNWIARDNKSTARLGSTVIKASVYYSVVESKTHYFLTYALYYPMRRDKNASVLYEHDFTGIVMVVDKATRSIKVVEGLKVDEGTDTIIAYKPNTSDTSSTGPQNLESFDPADFVDGRYPLMITSGSHEACNWVKSGPTLPAICRHEVREFSEGPTDGVLMRPGAAQTFAQAVDNTTTNIKEMEYELVPLGELWARRSFVGNDLLWEKVSVYEPIDGRPAKYNDTEPIVWPNRLVSDDEMSFGKPPFAWLKLASETNQATVAVRPVLPADGALQFWHRLQQRVLPQRVSVG
ncbi:MAG: Ig-like domain-containing protein [bacterium]